MAPSNRLVAPAGITFAAPGMPRRVSGIEKARRVALYFQQLQQQTALIRDAVTRSSNKK